MSANCNFGFSGVPLWCDVLKRYFLHELLVLALFAYGIFPESARCGEMVSLYDFGADEMGYLSLPEKQPVGSILMIPDSFGPRGVVKQRCDLMAKLGYVTLVVDLYNGNVSKNPEIARRLQDKLEFDVTVKAIQAGLKLLGESPRYQTNTLVVAVWGKNFQAAVAAATAVKSVTPDAISWLEPDGLQGLTSVTSYRMPLQLILRQETVGDSFEQGLNHFNQLRGMNCELTIIERERGFLLEPKSSPDGVEAWSAMIDFWHGIVNQTYSPQVVTGGKKQREVPSQPTGKPSSIVTRPKSTHPRLN